MKTQEDTIQVSIGIIYQNNQILITRRMDEVHLAGFWEFPGGKRQNEENLRDCLIREIKEELGIEVTIHQKLTPFTHHYPIGRISLHPFICSIKSGEPQPIGCTEFCWVSPSAIKTFSFPAANEPLLKKLESKPSPV